MEPPLVARRDKPGTRCRSMGARVGRGAIVPSRVAFGRPGRRNGPGRHAGAAGHRLLGAGRVATGAWPVRHDDPADRLRDPRAVAHPCPRPGFRGCPGRGGGDHPDCRGRSSERVALAGVAAIMVGIFCLIGGLAGLGFVADLLSRPVRTGYLAGIAATVIAGQIPSLLGFSVEGDGFFESLQGLVRGIDEADAATAAVGVGALAAILMLRRVNRQDSFRAGCRDPWNPCQRLARSRVGFGRQPPGGSARVRPAGGGRWTPSGAWRFPPSPLP